jgi:hypothetical protein
VTLDELVGKSPERGTDRASVQGEDKSSGARLCQLPKNVYRNQGRSVTNLGA